MENYLFVELYLQDRELGYSSGGSILLPSNIAIKIVEYLKQIGHWYTEDEPYDGVEFSIEICRYVEANIFEMPLSKLHEKFEIIIGFIDSSPFLEEMEMKKVLLVLTGMNNQTNSKIYTLIPSKLIDSIGLANQYCVDRLLIRNKTNNGRPIIRLPEYEYILEILSPKSFNVSKTVSHGITFKV